MNAHPNGPMPLTARRPGTLSGVARVPGDKSLSHRALILGGLSVGESRIRGLLEGDDVLRTAAAMRALGCEVRRDEAGTWSVYGAGVGGLAEPADVLDLGNSGTGVRLLMGAVACHSMTAFFTGDASLRRRPMGRVLAPLAQMGAQAASRSGGRLPLALTGGSLTPIEYRLPVPSAQVKSAILLAALGTPGTTTVLEPERTRDHTERMLTHFGAKLRAAPGEGGVWTIALDGCPELKGTAIEIPGDPSSAAFLVVAGLIVPGAKIRIEGVGLNPLRTGLYTTLTEMGARITHDNTRIEGGEPVADLVIEASSLQGVDVPPDRAPSMIDEYPVLAVAAACAKGRTVMRGLGELRVKESDRLGAIAAGLEANGVRCAIEGDTLTVEGCGEGAAVPGGGFVETRMDHRIAMAFLTLGLAAKDAVTVDDTRMIETSFPGFEALMTKLGAPFAAAGAP